jgi:hypothetical protein
LDEDAMAKDDAPPQFLKPGDDPEIDALLERLRKDGEDGDPLYVNYRKLRERARSDATGSARGAPSADAAPLASPPASVERPVEPQPMEVPAPQAERSGPRGAGKPRVPTQGTPRWLLWGTLAITAPVVALAIGYLWSHHTETSNAVVPSASATAVAVVSTAPSGQGADAPAAAASVTTAAPEKTAAPQATSPATNGSARRQPPTPVPPRHMPTNAAAPDAGANEPPTPPPKPEPTLPSELYQ